MPHSPWASSYPSLAAGKTLLAAVFLIASGATYPAENRLSFESGPGRAGVLAWQSAALTFIPVDASQEAASWQLDVEGLALANPLGSLHVDCSRGGLRQGRPWCADGQFEWHWPDERERLAGRLREPEAGPGLAFELEETGLTGSFRWPVADEQRLPDATIQFSGFDLAALPENLLAVLGLSVLEGRVDGRIEFSDERLALDLEISEAAFDRPDGLVAGAGLSVGLSGELEGIVEGERLIFSLGLLQHAGELLAGPVYLPSPEEPLEVDVAGVYRPGTSLSVDTLAIDDGGLVEARGGLEIEDGEDGWRLAGFTIDRARLEFPGAWRRWGDGPASSRGFGDLVTEGLLVASAAWRSGQLETLQLQFDDVSARDGAGRFALESVEGKLERSASRLQVDVGWDGLQVFSLAFGGSQLVATGAPGDWRLEESLRMPLLDGAVVIDELALGADEAGDHALALDARIEPLDLSELTRMLEFPVFGGELSGSFPGVRVRGDRITFAGGIDIQAFSGGIRLSELVIERPFGSLPALAAQVEIERLDLAELTGAFNFGHMEGELSGWMRDLRLLDWQPVAMDARLFTHDDAPNRRISQRAVAATEG